MTLVETLKQIVKWCIPYGLIEYRKKYIKQKEDTNKKDPYKEKKSRIKNYFLSLNPNEQKQDIREIIEYFNKNDFSEYPYSFTSKYMCNVFYDENCEMYYVLHKKKKTIFPQKNEYGIGLLVLSMALHGTRRGFPA